MSEQVDFEEMDEAEILQYKLEKGLISQEWYDYKTAALMYGGIEE